MPRPRLAADNRAILKDWLNYDDDRINALGRPAHWWASPEISAAAWFLPHNWGSVLLPRREFGDH